MYTAQGPASLAWRDSLTEQEPDHIELGLGLHGASAGCHHAPAEDQQPQPGGRADAGDDQLGGYLGTHMSTVSYHNETAPTLPPGHNQIAQFRLRDGV